MMEHSGRADDTPQLDRSHDFVALELAKLAATRLEQPRIDQFRKDLERNRSHHGDNRYLRLWFHIIDQGPEAVRRTLLEVSDQGQVLRSVASFRAFVSKDERDTIIRRHANGRH